VPTTSDLVTLGVATFVATNVDNFLLFATQLAVAPRPAHRSIQRGQFAASISVLLFCIGVRYALVAVPTAWFAVLALVPAYFTVAALRNLRHRTPSTPPRVRGAATAFMGTLAISADNAAAYLPLLRATHGLGDALVFAVWAVSLVVLIALATVVARHQRVVAVCARIGHLIEPALYAALAILIVVATGVL
jgi:cadmium resistance protein CadD (predicted permease)